MLLFQCSNLFVVYPARDMQVGEWPILQLIADSFGTNGSRLFSTNGSRFLELAAHVCSAAGESWANESESRSSAAGRCGDLVAVLAVKEAYSVASFVF